MTRIEIYQASVPKKKKGIYFVDYYLNNAHLGALRRTYLDIHDAKNDISYYGGYDYRLKDGFYNDLNACLFDLGYDNKTTKDDFPNSIETMLLVREYENELRDSILRLNAICYKMNIKPELQLKKHSTLC